jgi:peptidoglycan-N-acetylglucosamine deacetylase
MRGLASPLKPRKALALVAVLLGLGVTGCFPVGQAPKKVDWAKLRSQDPAWKAASLQIRQQGLRPSVKVLQPVLYSGSGQHKTVALTFDDGPHYLFTPAALDILKEERVPAAFFVIGRMAVRHPDLMKRIVADGHELGNHSYSHASLAHLTPHKMQVEYLATQNIVRDLTGVTMKWARPPGGSMNSHVTASAAANGLVTVLWSVAPKDYQRPSWEVLWDRVQRQLQPGGILILHDGPPSTLRDLRRLIRTLREEGWKFATLEELAQETDTLFVKPVQRPELAAPPGAP